MAKKIDHRPMYDFKNKSWGLVQVPVDDDLIAEYLLPQREDILTLYRLLRADGKTVNRAFLSVLHFAIHSITAGWLTWNGEDD